MADFYAQKFPHRVLQNLRSKSHVTLSADFMQIFQRRKHTDYGYAMETGPNRCHPQAAQVHPLVN